MKWLRLYSEILNDRKVQTLPPEIFKHWINLLCLASENDERGVLPSVPDIAFALRITESEAEFALQALTNVGLIEIGDNGAEIHNWDGRQFDSDNVSERVRKSRNKSKKECNVSRNVTCNVIEESREDTDTDTDTEKSTLSPRAQEFEPVADITEARVELESAVWQAVGKFTDWQMGTVSNTDRRDVAKIAAKLERDKRTDADVLAYSEKLPRYLGRAPADTTPPRPSQMLSNFDAVLNFTPREDKPDERKQHLPARVASDDAAAKRFLAKQGTPVSNGRDIVPNARRPLAAAANGNLHGGNGSVLDSPPEQSTDTVAGCAGPIRQRDTQPRGG